ncbi:hypothetical protein BDP55DRAFT_666611 [Colletotrichum godetiae]|uniref:C2H2-type domain-containing protein n=1 Tax=Colletotrichum godetiae TaxID=1209918 RepID=A0AAJ0AL95_9PEZI|nr:uncharacterized protein BDP55DRAFT_666611 [Colletotrichum godetiae]KAK1674488.1 hypothetical protein BDP55DRAFT_666611 [Colletotrichum godetiae]
MLRTSLAHSFSENSLHCSDVTSRTGILEYTMATVEETPLMLTRAIEFFRCVTFGCTSKPFPTRANLTRHITAVHGPPTKMPCGKFLRSHSSNVRRHQQRCSVCLLTYPPNLPAPEESHAMPRRRRSQRLSRNVQQVTVDNGIPAQDEPSGYVIPDDLYLQAADDGTRDTSYEDNFATSFSDPLLDTTFANTGTSPGDNYTFNGMETWDEVLVSVSPHDPSAEYLH